MFYCFYSRKNGYKNGNAIRSYSNGKYKDVQKETDFLIDLSGKEIINKLTELKSPLLNNNEFMKLVFDNQNWYYYPYNTIIYDIRCFE